MTGSDGSLCSTEVRGAALALLVALAFPAVGQWTALEAPNATGDPGWWEEPIDASACGAGWIAIWDVYDSTGARRPWVWHIEGNTNTWIPIIGDNEGAAAGVAVCGDGAVWAATRFATSDSLGLSAPGVIGGWAGCSMPESEWGFLSAYSEFRGVAADGNRVAVVGMSLDPCCVHRELPVLAVMDVGGALEETFSGGMVAVDVAGPVLVDTLGATGPLPQCSENINGTRHDDVGFFQSVAFDGEALVAGGAYANPLHYEVMVVRFNSNGTLDGAFGDQGMVRLNLDPGNNTWVESLAVLPNGNIQCLVRAHNSGDLESAFHLLTLDGQGQILNLTSSDGSIGLEAHGMEWGGGAWTAWGADENGAVVGRWSDAGDVESQTLPSASGWLSARGAWNGETLAAFGRSEPTPGNPIAHMATWQLAPFQAITPYSPSRTGCSGISPQPCPSGTIPILPFSAAMWYDFSGRRLNGAPTQPGWHLVRSPSGTTCPVIFQ